jgi:outer membrane protein assembly factor BamB
MKLTTAALITIAVLGLISCTDPAPASGTLLWKASIGGEIWSSLTLADGMLYFGSDDSSMYAFDTKTRSIRWKFETDGIIRSSADVADGIISFASDDGNVYALEIETGIELWKFDLGSSGTPRFLPDTLPPYVYDYMQSSPVSQDGILYAGSGSGSLYALDLATGEKRWQFDVDARIRSTPAIDERHVYVGTWDGNLYALTIESGDIVWQYDCGGIIQSSPATGGGSVFIGSRSAKVFALDASTGAERWIHVHEDGSWVESSPVYDDGTIYIGSSDALKLFAFDAASGAVAWEFRTGGWSWATPVLSDGRVYIGGVSAYPYYFEGVDLKRGFYAVDTKTGKLAWSMEPEPLQGYITGGIFASPAIAEGVIYVAGLDGILYAFKE